MKKTFLLCLFLICCFLPSCEKDQTEASEFKKPIESLDVVVEEQVLEVGDTLNIEISYLPSDTDDELIYDDYDESILKYENNTFSAVGVGETVLCIHSKSASVREIIPIKVMPKKNGNEAQHCKGIVEAATLSIKNYGYNKNSWGYKTNEFTAVSSATIIGKVGNKYLFIAAYEDIGKMSGLEYQSLTATDYKGNNYKVVRYYKDENRASNSYEMGIGVIETSNDIGVLTVGDRATYFKGERLYLNDLGTFIECTMYNTTAAGPSVATLDLAYLTRYYGDIILDSDYNLVGMVAKEDALNKKTYFFVTWTINDFFDGVIKSESKN